MTDYVSLVDRARNPDNLIDRVGELERLVRGLQGRDVRAQNLNELAPDVWGLNTSFPSICQGRLTLASGNPVPVTNQQGDTLYFSPYQGNLIGMYNNSTWDQVPFSELSLPLKSSQNGTTTNGSAVVTGLTDTSQLVVGMVVSGTGVTAGTTISTIDSATQITMSANATASGTVSLSLWVPDITLFDVFIVDTGAGQLALRMIFWTAMRRQAITNVTNASPPVVTSNGHGLSTGNMVWIKDVVGSSVNSTLYRVGTTTANTFQLKTVTNGNPAAPGAYTSGGQFMQYDDYSNAGGSGRGVRASALALQDGIYVLASNPTWRYLGTGMTGAYNNGAGGRNAITDGLTGRNLWNYYNRKQRVGFYGGSTGAASWNAQATNTWEFDQNTIESRIIFVVGVWEDEIVAQKKVTISVVSSNNGQSGISWDTDLTNGPPLAGYSENANAGLVRSDAVSTVSTSSGSGITGNPGFHAIVGEERASSTTNVAFIGSVNAGAQTTYYMIAYIWS